MPRDPWLYFTVSIFETPPNLECKVPVFVATKGRINFTVLLLASIERELHRAAA
jgi:hypothetical protein